MYLGKIVEVADRETLYHTPHHPYTQALLSSIPQIGAGKKKMTKILTGEIPSPINPPAGCAFRGLRRRDILQRHLGMGRHNVEPAVHRRSL